MLAELALLRTEIERDITETGTAESLEQFRLKHLVKKGTLQGFIERLREVPKEEKPATGKELNALRTLAEGFYEQKKAEYEQSRKSHVERIDVTLPGRRPALGSLHPIQQTLDGCIAIFEKMGFSVAEGPDVENDYHNFGALNFAPDHPARDMQDTFFIRSGTAEDLLLRTHTSSVQIRVMKSQKPPIRSIMPGRVFRNETVSARSLAEFHQLEGLYIDKRVTFAELKGTIITFAREMYGKNSEFRFRPSYFPFTEPSAEVDISCYLCGGKGCRICKYSGWLEICGCGMVHPNVLKNCDIDPEEYSGYAFGFGIERVTLLRTGIDDIRLLYENDVRVLGQFR